MSKPRIACICGSSRFICEIAVLAWQLEKEGTIALGMHLLPEYYAEGADHQAELEGVAEQMDELHLRKIDLADVVYVVAVGGYMGESTKREVAYARGLGKPMSFLDGRALGREAFSAEGDVTLDWPEGRRLTDE